MQKRRKTVESLLVIFIAEGRVMASCPNCASVDLVCIDLRPQDGYFRFSSCRTCEHKWWTGPAEQVEVRLPEVIAAVATTGRAR